LERQAIAESLGVAAGRLENGIDRYFVDEYIRRTIATLPGNGQWAKEIDKILQTAFAEDAVKYAENLRLVAKGLKR